MDKAYIEPIEAEDWSLGEGLGLEEDIAQEAEVLAFATDEASRSALWEGLAGEANAQVWPGSLKEAANALRGGHTPKIIVVDSDTTLYPAGAVHELAQVCERGTAVVAFGSDASATFSREMLRLGLTDYLVKPISAAGIAHAVERARAGEGAADAQGRLVTVSGAPGAGASTVAAAMAACAGANGQYVAVLDLDRTFASAAFLLDVEPTPGLTEVLSTAANAALHPEVIESLAGPAGERTTVYGYAWSAAPAPLAPAWAICEMLMELQRRAHLVIVDGMDDPATRQTLAAVADARVLVFEPTRASAAHAQRLLEGLAPMRSEDSPVVVVRNHTREKSGERDERGAGVGERPAVEIPYENALAQSANRGLDPAKIPKRVREPLEAVLAHATAGEARTAGPSAVASPLLDAARQLLRPRARQEETR